ncbi:MAG: class I SAM-dependent methyltransferase [Thermodesulfobacteriota bacterium]
MKFFIKDLDKHTLLFVLEHPLSVSNPLRNRKSSTVRLKELHDVKNNPAGVGPLFRPIDIRSLPVTNLHRQFEFHPPFESSPDAQNKILTQWQMEIDDAPIFRYLYRHFKPQRHLEFGTWQGTGVMCCLEECGATVWTINLPEGETRADGDYSYQVIPLMHGFFPPWATHIPLWVKRKLFSGAGCQTDAIGMIGRLYLEKQLGKRVCQIYCDSRDWDISNYPEGFFDSVLIDGGHSREVVISDTRKALSLVRPGGLVMWHDFCPVKEVYETFESVRGVYDAVSEIHDWLAPQMADLFWINPSWILAGIRK